MDVRSIVPLWSASFIQCISSLVVVAGDVDSGGGGGSGSIVT